nr:nucleotide exchange factor GrpE [Marinitoga lauensis]
MEVENKSVKRKEQELDKDMEDLKKEIEELKKELENQKGEKEKLIGEYEKIKNYAINLKVDFENYKDIVQKEKIRIKKEAKESVIKQLLPIYKNFSIVMNNRENLDIFAQGLKWFINHLLKQLKILVLNLLTLTKMINLILLNMMLLRKLKLMR